MYSGVYFSSVASISCISMSRTKYDRDRHSVSLRSRGSQFNQICTELLLDINIINCFDGEK